MATWPACSRAVGRRPASSAMRPRQATSVSTLAWPLRWPSSRFLAGRAASSGICTPRDAMPSSSIRKRRSWSSAGPESGHASSRGGTALGASYKRQIKRNERSEEGVGTRLIASHGAGKGGTRETVARWPSPRPVGRDQSGPYYCGNASSASVMVGGHSAGRTPADPSERNSVMNQGGENEGQDYSGQIRGDQHLR